MSSHRNLRIAEAIREVVATAILFDAADPRIRSVTVLGVEVSGDLRQATVNVSVMGSQAEQNLALKGLKHAAGYFQSLVAKRLQTRFTPILHVQARRQREEVRRDRAASSKRPLPPTASPTRSGSEDLQPG